MNPFGRVFRFRNDDIIFRVYIGLQNIFQIGRPVGLRSAFQFGAIFGVFCDDKLGITVGRVGRRIDKTCADKVVVLANYDEMILAVVEKPIEQTAAAVALVPAVLTLIKFKARVKSSVPNKAHDKPIITAESSVMASILAANATEENLLVMMMAQVRVRKRGKTFSYIFEAGKTSDGRRKVVPPNRSR